MGLLRAPRSAEGATSARADVALNGQVGIAPARVGLKTPDFQKFLTLSPPGVL